VTAEDGADQSEVLEAVLRVAEDADDDEEDADRIAQHHRRDPGLEAEEVDDVAADEEGPGGDGEAGHHPGEVPEAPDALLGGHGHGGQERFLRGLFRELLARLLGHLQYPQTVKMTAQAAMKPTRANQSRPVRSLRAGST